MDERNVSSDTRELLKAFYKTHGFGCLSLQLHSCRETVVVEKKLQLNGGLEPSKAEHQDAEGIIGQPIPIV